MFWRHGAITVNAGAHAEHLLCVEGKVSVVGE